MTYEGLITFLKTNLQAIPIAALAAWLGTLWSGRIIEKLKLKNSKEIELLKSELKRKDEMALTIHRLQFEKEFNIYNELWTKVVKVQEDVNKVRMNISSEDIDDGKEFGALLTQLQLSTTDLEDTSKRLRPFYNSEVFRLMSETALFSVNAAFGQVTLKKADSDKTIYDGKQIGVTIDKYNKVINSIEKIIRERIGNLYDSKIIG